MHRRLEGRLAQIAWLALASSACKPSDPPPVMAAPMSATSPDAGAAATGVVTTVDAVDASVSAPSSPPDPQKVCAQYRAKTANDPDGANAKDPSQVTRVPSAFLQSDTFGRRLDGEKIECRVVWDRQSTSETIMVAPTCCPQARGNTPCPPASPATFPGTREKVEVAVVTNDAARVSSTVSWQLFVQEPARHMCGRRPEGFASDLDGGSACSIGACLVEMAELEAASITAFERLARELVAFGAPQPLVDAARAARRDEVRHARVMRSLARRFGAAVRAPRATKPLAVRDRFAVAVENAVEGCVNETLGAVVATFQAERAGDPIVRAAFVRIAEDERRHAALAWEIDAWLSTQLTRSERAGIAEARHDARNRLRAIDGSEDEETQRALGLPAMRERRVMVDAVNALA